MTPDLAGVRVGQEVVGVDVCMRHARSPLEVHRILKELLETAPDMRGRSVVN
jgi:hypothetical protein